MITESLRTTATWRRLSSNLSISSVGEWSAFYNFPNWSMKAKLGGLRTLG